MEHPSKSPLQQFSALVPLIQKMATDIATQVVNKTLNDAKFNVPQIPDHHHNGTDSSTLDPTESVDGFQLLPATAGGVVNPTVLGNQTVSQGPVNVAYGNLANGNNSTLQGKFTSYPIPIIYGHGAGADSAFNGGYAPVGTVVFFVNPPNTALQIKVTADTPGTAGTWLQITAP